MDFSEYTDKKVVVTIEGQGEVEGVVEAGSPVGIVFRAKSQRRGVLIEGDRVLAIAEQAEKPKPLRGRVIPIVRDGKHRLHLIERHGFKVSEVAALSEEEAKDFHDTIDHSDLGHSHRPKTEAELAIEQAELDRAEDED